MIPQMRLHGRWYPHAKVAATKIAKAEASKAQAPDPDEVKDAATPHDLTIEQLAGEVGMSVRNIRNHHSRGLLPAPEVRARVGFYGADHVARLRLILDLQADGFNLAAIERLLSGSDGLAERLLGLRHAVTTPFEAETPEVVTAKDLTEELRPGQPEGHRARTQAEAARATRRRPLRSPQPRAFARRRRGRGARHLAARDVGSDGARQP